MPNEELPERSRSVAGVWPGQARRSAVDGISLIIIGDFIRGFAPGAQALGRTVMSANLSAAQLADPQLVPDVQAVLARLGMPASALELEIPSRSSWTTQDRKSVV